MHVSEQAASPPDLSGCTLVTVDDDRFRALMAPSIVRYFLEHSSPARDARKWTWLDWMRLRLDHPAVDTRLSVTVDDVTSAQLAAFRVGVTYETHLRFVLLRRKLEARADDCRGLFVRDRDVPPHGVDWVWGRLWKASRLSLIALLDHADNDGTQDGANSAGLRELITAIFADMCRPLK